MQSRVSHNHYTSIIKISCHAHLLNQNKTLLHNSQRIQNIDIQIMYYITCKVVQQPKENIVKHPIPMLHLPEHDPLGRLH